MFIFAKPTTKDTFTCINLQSPTHSLPVSPRLVFVYSIVMQPSLSIQVNAQDYQHTNILLGHHKADISLLILSSTTKTISWLIDLLTFRPQHTLFFITIRSSIARDTLTDCLMILLDKTATSMVTNETGTWIQQSITCRSFITSLTFASIRCPFIDTSTIVA